MHTHKHTNNNRILTPKRCENAYHHDDKIGCDEKS